ncbi:hypothetical protein [Leptolyngbya sp. 7M]|uniref:hypothetical protein n=1 Tax=Leptolyngbya sp. 7M TaxID=2812896 RepID=UPI001B8ADEF1|nr:hypothetical protein [Leptolyngbya sp. 7M]QYO62583.1 hypothetical protein JVX88_21295 [Leptolyngbya sp. 7M]
MKHLTSKILLFASLGLITACGGGGGGGGTPNPNAGFRMQTYAQSQTGNIFFPTAAQVNGQFLQPNGTTTGTLETFNLSHSGVGQLIASGARVPATWRLTLGPNIPGGGAFA